MSGSRPSESGYVYVLEVKDIALPVSKIGMTRRDPKERCAEINKSSTGDFIWEVAYQVAVDNCQKLESLVHSKLGPLRQKGREFFNLSADDAFTALRSIMESQSEVNEIPNSKIIPLPSTQNHTKLPKRRRTQFRKVDSQYADALQSFASLLGVKGRPFGQLSQPEFGMSDGVEGVQWNLEISPETDVIRLGVNLEGMKYSDWPISKFILAERKNPTLERLKAELTDTERIFVRFMRDAWRVQSRPKILERHIGGGPLAMSELDNRQWLSLLEEALQCLDSGKSYRGRSQQQVTLASPPKTGERRRLMQVSPHINVYRRIDPTRGLEAELEEGIERLSPVHDWISRLSR